MSHLWRQLPGGVRRLFVRTFGSAADAEAFLEFAAATHDLGKASREFAFKAYQAGRSDVADTMRAQGLDVPTSVDKPLPHGVLGQAHLVGWLKRHYDIDPLRAQHLGGIIGGHHGSNPSADDVNEAAIRLAAESRQWQLVRDEILDVLAQATGASEALPRWLSRDIPVTVQVLTAALVIMADWISSDEALFPYGPAADKRVEMALARLNLPGAWTPVEESAVDQDLFGRRFPRLGSQARPNAMQREMLRLASEMQTPGLMLLEAPMGSGKTEGALLAAEELARRFGLGGVFIGLPTMATSNPMFSRVREWIETVPSLEPVSSVTLAHSKAGLNDEFAGLMPWAQKSSIYDEDTSLREAAATVHAWFLGRKRGMLANHVIGTIDQALFAALKAKHVVLRHLGLASKVVIIDEVHAADDYMRTYLKRVLVWLGAYGTPVILMSATLPPAQRQELLQAYADGRGGTLSTAASVEGYPRIQLVDQAGLRSSVVEPVGTGVQVRLTHIDDQAETLTKVLRESLAEGGCVGVICNTVARAQEVHADLLQELGWDVQLLHSRFLAPHRAVREADLVRRLGRDGSDRPERLVVVGTQVLEQSLDIDFDLLVTDLAPVDLLLQRIGRLHRHERPRPALLEEPVCMIRGVSDWDVQPPEFPAGSIAVYGADLLLRAAAAVLSLEKVVIPEDIPTLVARAYSPRPDCPESWQSAVRAATQFSTKARERRVGKAGSFLLGDPRRMSNLNALIVGAALDPDDAQGFQQVRDSEDSLEVIVVVRDDDGYRLPDDIGPHSRELIGYGTPDGPVARALAACTIALPHSLSGAWIVDQVIDELEAGVDVSAWQASPWLKGQLVMAIEPDGSGRLVGRRISYDLGRGLVVEPEQKAE